MSPTTRSDAPTTQGTRRPNIEVPATATSTPSVTDTEELALGLRNRRPAVFGSLYAPCGRRRMWAVSFRCPHCGGVHFGRSRAPDVGGVRRSGCGRLVWLVIVRVYRVEVDR
jgi:hypothetical protein